MNTEFELFARIRLLQDRLIEGLPPQSQNGEYELMVRQFFDQTITVSNYFSTVAREIADITILEKKADLLDIIFNLMMGEPDEHLRHLLNESPFTERAIRGEALEFIGNYLDEIGALNHPFYNISNNPQSAFQKRIVRSLLEYLISNVQQHGHQSAFYLRFLDHFRGNG